MTTTKIVRGVSTLQVHALASGSSGNAMLVREGATNLLIDAGISVRKIARALTAKGLTTSDLNGILLTHEHSDHMIGAIAASRRYNAPLVANAATFAELRRRNSIGFQAIELSSGGSTELGEISVRSFGVSHDAVEPVGYVLRYGATQLTYFTDTGCVTDAIRDALEGATIAVVEANYDPDMLLRGPYPEYRKARVASESGHLSNQDCGDLLAERLERGGSMSIWLAHLSRVNNSPALARRTIQERIAARTQVPYTLEVALRDQPSLIWSAPLPKGD